MKCDKKDCKNYSEYYEESNCNKLIALDIDNNKECDLYKKLPPKDTEITTQQKIEKTINNFKDFLLEKNKRYGDSALNPKRIFSKLDSKEQLKIRMDDKISRIINSEELRTNDVTDLIGYLFLYLISVEKYDFEEFLD